MSLIGYIRDKVRSVVSAKPRRPSTMPADGTGLTIVTPSYEGHYQQFARLLDSVRTHCVDQHLLTYVVVVEAANVPRFRALFREDDRFSSRIMTTEEALAHFGVHDAPSRFLERVGKFTFQTLKKFGALYHAGTRWSLVLDSETLFVNPFSVAELVADYAARKYIFFSRTEPRGADWNESLGKEVLRCCVDALTMPSTDRWYMEYFHWFYETDKVRDLIDHHLNASFHNNVRSGTERRPYFEVILYYMYMEKVWNNEYTFLDIFDELAKFVPARIMRRFTLAELPFSRFGNEYLMNVLEPDEVSVLSGLFAAYRLPFLRLEPPLLSHRYIEQARLLPHFCAFISSQHLGWLGGRIAVCVSDGFATDDDVLHHQLGELVGFLSGVECDLFVHGRDTPARETIEVLLRPTRARFERAPDLHHLLEQVASADPDDPRADDLLHLWSVQRSFDLISSPADYDHVVAIRPGLVGDLSLKEIMIAISDNGDILPDTVYFPRALHGRGINIDLAVGPTAQMAIRARTFDHICERVADHVFDAHVSMLEAIVAGGVHVALAEMAYSDMSGTLPGTAATYHRFHHQFAHWWGRNQDLPLHKDVSAHFANKLAAARARLRDDLPARFEMDTAAGSRFLVEVGPEDPVARVVPVDAAGSEGEAWDGVTFATPSPKGVTLTRWQGRVVEIAVELPTAS